MSYVMNSLNAGEEVLFKERISLFTRFWSITVGLVFLVFGAIFVMLNQSTFSTVLFVLAACLFLSVFLDYWCTEFVVTNLRVIAKRGFISRSVVEIRLRRVESVQIKQGIIGRLFNFGSLIIGGAGNPLDRFTGIRDPLLFRDQVVEAQQEYDATDRR